MWTIVKLKKKNLAINFKNAYKNDELNPNEFTKGLPLPSKTKSRGILWRGLKAKYTALSLATCDDVPFVALEGTPWGFLADAKVNGYLSSDKGRVMRTEAAEKLFWDHLMQNYWDHYARVSTSVETEQPVVAIASVPLHAPLTKVDGLNPAYSLTTEIPNIIVKATARSHMRIISFGQKLMMKEFVQSPWTQNPANSDEVVEAALEEFGMIPCSDLNNKQGVTIRKKTYCFENEKYFEDIFVAGISTHLNSIDGIKCSTHQNITVKSAKTSIECTNKSDITTTLKMEEQSVNYEGEVSYPRGKTITGENMSTCPKSFLHTLLTKVV